MTRSLPSQQYGRKSFRQRKYHVPLMSDRKGSWRNKQAQKVECPLHHPKQCELYPNEVSEKPLKQGTPTPRGCGPVPVHGMLGTGPQQASGGWARKSSSVFVAAPQC